jgi:catechol 2,3-dioxygenase-like lactoylglutathione lyase family enzyme
MSHVFGPVVQRGYVVPEIEAAVRHWLARGVGPFFIEEHIRPPGQFDDGPTRPDLSAAFAYSGDQQIEVIQQFDDAPTIYREYLTSNPSGGLQHVAFWVDDITATLEELSGAGHDFCVRQRFGDMHAYIDSEKEPGVMIQLMARNELMVALFDLIKAGADSWDGKTDPVRRIDWSTGSPRVADPV